MHQYRERFYKEYFRSQAARSSYKINIQDKLRVDERHFQQEIIPLIDMPKDARVLDMGCGYGSLVYTLIKAGYKNTLGVDLSEEQIKIAKQLGIQEVQLEDVQQHLLNNKNTYDVITGIDIIEHFDKDEVIVLLDQVKDALKPDGIAIFRTPNVDAPYSTVFYYGDFTHELFLNFSSATQLMENIGFSRIQVLSGVLLVKGAFRNFLRKCIWHVLIFFSRILLFSSGRTSSTVIFTPNLIIKVRK